MELNNILEAVNEMSEEELTELVYSIKDRRDVLRTKSLSGFRVDDKVKWTHGQGMNKEHYEGRVYKINPKTIAVKVTNKPWCRWRISPSMLTKIKGDKS